MHFLGIDVGSISTKVAVLDAEGKLAAGSVIATLGAPVDAVREGLQQVVSQAPGAEIASVAVTGSGRELVSTVLKQSIVKNEITAQAAAAVFYQPNVRTVIEIGGQDSKLILIRDGLVADFGMNTVCAAGTGSFLDHQAARLGLSLEELGALALKSQSPVHITGRCTVFAESDMVHQQQTGTALEDIVYGLCKTLVRNYLTSVAAGKEMLPPIVFQGGVARNPGMQQAFEEELGFKLEIPSRPELTGAVGAALLAQKQVMDISIALSSVSYQ
jgi:predicted CoA-substrate-specific enzyme activase